AFFVGRNRRGFTGGAERKHPGDAVADQVLDNAPDRWLINRAGGRERGDHGNNNAAVFQRASGSTKEIEPRRHEDTKSKSGKNPLRGFVVQSVLLFTLFKTAAVQKV